MLTHLQYIVMNRIAHDEYCATNGGTPDEANDVHPWFWPDEWAADLGLTGQQIGGVITTLTEAGYLGVEKVAKKRGQPDESNCWFTESGFAAWAEIHHCDDDIDYATEADEATGPFVIAE